MTPNHTMDTNPSTARLAYASPSLKLFGEVRELTEGGSAGTDETMSMGTGVNCGTNLMRRC
jgi:hypothetical protein